MKKTRGVKKIFFPAALLAAISAHAQYHSYSVGSGADCIVQTYRSPDVPPGVYDAIHEENVNSSDGGSGYFYGGFTHQNNVNGVDMALVQYVCWPASGSFPVSYDQQIPVFAGTNMVGYSQLAEGSSCAIKGYWPEFQTNLWVREAIRYWQPTDGTTHLGYQGMWMKEPVSGNWYHLGTFQYPFTVTGVNGMSGWQENIGGGYAGDYKVDHAGGYYHKAGNWLSANQISFTSGGYTYKTNDSTYATSFAESDCGPSFTNLYNNPNTVVLSDQSSAPTFDPIIVSNATASTYSSQLLVQWQMPLNSSPQLSYLVEVFTNSSYTGTATLSYFDNNPEVREKLLNLTNIATPYVRLTISDIFFNTNTPILIAPTAATLSPASNVSGTVNGLAYQYFQSSSGNWMSLPNFSSLTPVLQGAVGFPDVSPRQQRVNYGFNFSGYFNAPTDGIYNFTLHSGDGSALTIDGATVINFDGLHDSSQFMGGGIALAAGLHNFNLQFFKGAANPVNTTAYTDGLGLSYEGPGIAKMDIPASAFVRVPGNNEPTIVMNSPTNNSALLNSSPGFSASVTTNGNIVNGVQFFLTDYYSYYARPSSGVDYFIGSDSGAPFDFNSLVWAAPTNLIRARLIYNGTNTIDSMPVAISTTNGSFGAWIWTPLEIHNYPSGAAAQNGTFSMVGDGMNMLSRQVTGDCTFIAHLAGITPNIAGPDGIMPDSSWRAGIIFRGTTNTTIGQPLGDGTTTRFTALFSSVGNGTYYEDDTMRNGNGDANAWSGNLGGANQWYKLQRVGNIFYSSVSPDGANWTLVYSNTLSNIGSTIYAGVFIDAEQSMNSNIHHASFDSYSLTGAGVVGPTSVIISPQTNTVLTGLSTMFAASVVGPVPASYQWQLNGANIPNATNATYTIANAAFSDAGSYAVVADGVTSAPAILILNEPAGSGVWINANGGSWNANNNWSGGTIANGVDSVADFSTLNLSLSPTVTLDGARTNGALLFGDVNSAAKHDWTLSAGSGGTLTLASSSGTPGIFVDRATNIINAVIAGAQGFNKTGAGYLQVGSASTILGTINVNAGTLEMQNKSGDTPYSIAAGATLKIGYSTGGGYANTALIINGNGAADPSGFYLAGGKTYNVSGGVNLNGAPTTIRSYGSGAASLGIFDINETGLWCAAAASGSMIDTNVQFVNDGYGMALQVDAGTNNAFGDLIMNGALNINANNFAGGLIKRGTGSLRLNGVAATANSGLAILSGSVICGTSNCVGPNALLNIQSGTVFDLNGTSQTISNATLAGTLKMTLAKGSTPASSQLTLNGSTLTYGGILILNNLSTNALAAGDTFTLFNAPSYAGGFSSIVTVPQLPVGMSWNTNNLAVNGTISIVTNGISFWNGGGANGNWNTPANWNGTLPTNGQSLVFQGTLQPNNTNNFLASAGQIVFANGGFALRGNSISLLWGLLNQSGNNTWSINTTLTGAQSFVSSNGTLNVSSAIANAGFALTLDGAGTDTISGVISGTGGLVKNGTGSTTISAQQTFSGGTIINTGVLNLTGGGGSSGPIRGAVTVNNGGTLQISTGDGFGYNADNTVINPLNIFGGTVNVNSTANQTLGDAVINMTGGAISGSTAGNLDFFQGSSTLNTFASSNTAIISGISLSPLRQGSTTFTVAAGTTPSGIDLDISSVLRTSPSGDAAGAIFYKAGNGTMRLNAVNTFAKPVVVNAGTLLVNGSLSSGSAVTISPGATLGGTGTINGQTTVQGTLAPGNFGIGKLSFGNTLSLAGNTIMEISKNGALTNDVVSVAGALTQGGSLIVTNIGPNALAVGDSFALFKAASYGGGFTNLALPSLANNLAWNTNNLAVNGTLTVTTNSPPTFGNIQFQTGNGLSLSATGVPGQTYVLQGATNLAPPVIWLPLFTNVAGSNGQLVLGDAQATNFPQRFYRLSLQ